METIDPKIKEAIDLAAEAMNADGDHHKTWYIDQIVRVLVGDKYPQIVEEYKSESVDWKEGVQP